MRSRYMDACGNMELGAYHRLRIGEGIIKWTARFAVEATLQDDRVEDYGLDGQEWRVIMRIGDRCRQVAGEEA